MKHCSRIIFPDWSLSAWNTKSGVFWLVDMGKRSHKMKEPKIRRPVNAFMLWAKTERKRLAKELAIDDNPALSKILGKRWKEMSKDKKRVHMMEAEHLRQQHLKEYPNFKYSPKAGAVELERQPVVGETASKNVSIAFSQSHQPVLHDFVSNESMAAVTVQTRPEPRGTSEMNTIFQQQLGSGFVLPVASDVPQTQSMPGYIPEPTATLNIALMGTFEFRESSQTFLTTDSALSDDNSDLFGKYTPAMDLLPIEANDLGKYLDIWTTTTPTPAYMAEDALEGVEPMTHWNIIQGLNSHTIDIETGGGASLADLLAPLRE